MNSLTDEAHKSGIKMLVTIVNRMDGNKTIRFLQSLHLHLQFSCMAQGTRGAEIMDMLGLDSVDKTVVFCVSLDFHIDEALPLLAERMQLKKAGKGIAFTIPLFDISLPEIPERIRDRSLQWRKDMEDEVVMMNEGITHSIILSVVNKGFSEALMKTAKAAGATGGTVVKARQTGTEDTVKFFGISVQDEKELVAILTKREARQAIVDAINGAYGIESEAGGIVLSLPVDSVVGMS